MVCRDMKNLDETGHLIEKACQLFQEHGSPDTAAMSLERGAKYVLKRCLLSPMMVVKQRTKLICFANIWFRFERCYLASVMASGFVQIVVPRN